MADAMVDEKEKHADKRKKIEAKIRETPLRNIPRMRMEELLNWNQLEIHR